MTESILYDIYSTDIYKIASLDRIKLTDTEELECIYKYQRCTDQHTKDILFDKLFRHHHALIILLTFKTYYKLAKYRSILYEELLLNMSFDDALSISYDLYYACLKNYAGIYSFSTYFYKSLGRYIVSRYNRSDTSYLSNTKYEVKKLSFKLQCALSDNPNQSIHDILTDEEIKKIWACDVVHNKCNVDDYDIECRDDYNYDNDYANLMKEFEDIAKKMNKRYADMLRWRLKGLTLEEIGTKYGITRERIRQLTDKAIEKVKLELKYQHVRKLFKDIIVAKPKPKRQPALSKNTIEKKLHKHIKGTSSHLRNCRVKVSIKKILTTHKQLSRRDLIYQYYLMSDKWYYRAIATEIVRNPDVGPSDICLVVMNNDKYDGTPPKASLLSITNKLRHELGPNHRNTYHLEQTILRLTNCGILKLKNGMYSLTEGANQK